jgi:hypothetical protein
LPTQIESNHHLIGDFLSFEQVFLDRANWLGTTDGILFRAIPSPAMYFPWELIGNDNQFIARDAFSELETLASGNQYFQATQRTLHDLCKAIWERAQREISEATTISFIGLSMHEFLKPGLRYLFAERNKKIEEKADRLRERADVLEIVLACPGALAHGTKFNSLPHPHSLAGKLLTTLKAVCPNIDRRVGHDRGKAGTGEVVCYDNFADFIKSEL